MIAALLTSGAAFACEVSCTYVAHVTHVPQGAQVVHVWVPLAKTRPEQRILQRVVRVDAPYAIARDPDYDNDILHLTLIPPMPDHVDVIVEYRAILAEAGVAQTESHPTAAELRRHLRPSGLVIVNDEVRARSRRATRGRWTLTAQARGIYDAVRHAMTYDKTAPGWGHGDTRRACLLGKGNCTDFHSLFISMARAAHIPARFKIGFVIPDEPAGAIPGYHCWAEFYDAGRGWTPVDASEAWKHPELADYYFGARDPHRFIISVGRGIRLVPRPQGAPVNILFYPYVEIDGQAFSDVSVEIMFANRQQERAT